MRTEQEIVDILTDKFSFLKDRISIQRNKRIFTDFLEPELFEQVLRHVHDEMGFYKGHHVVGTDEGADLGFVYLVSDKAGIILAIKEKVSKENPKIKSMSSIYPSFLLHERELKDLFGADIDGLPKGPSYPLPDGWPAGNYPMRKEWNPDYFDRETMTYNPPVIESEGEDK